MPQRGSGLHLALLATFLLGFATLPNVPAKAVREFYEFHFAQDMGFTPESVREREKWLAPDLVALCDAYFQRPSSPEEVPAIDGDPFTNSQEYPKTFRVGTARVTGEVARVPVRLYWSAGPPRSVTVHLVRIAGKWMIWDVIPASGPSFRKLLGG